MTDPAPERWLVVRVRVAPSGGGPAGDPDGPAGLMADALVELGARAVQEVDGWFVTHVPEPADPAAWIAEAEEVLRARTAPTGVEVRTEWQRQEDWSHLWKRGLSPRRVTDRLVVTPTWREPELREGDLVVRMDPGMAFGTAEHGTTRGCLRLLDRTVQPGDRVLDVGAGSGLLAIAAARLGATVTALEGDPLAVATARENVASNEVAHRVTVRQCWASADDLAGLGPRDGAVANIEPGVLATLLPGFRSILPAGAWLVLGGVPAREWTSFESSVRDHGFGLVDVDTDGAWRSGLFRRG